MSALKGKQICDYTKKKIALVIGSQRETFLKYVSAFVCNEWRLLFISYLHHVSFNDKIFADIGKKAIFKAYFKENMPITAIY